MWGHSIVFTDEHVAVVTPESARLATKELERFRQLGCQPFTGEIRISQIRIPIMRIGFEEKAICIQCPGHGIRLEMGVNVGRILGRLLRLSGKNRNPAGNRWGRSGK